jgi:hypothetical protein
LHGCCRHSALGVGGPVAGGHQYLSWIAPDDLVHLYLAALDDPAWTGPVNATAPEPVTDREFVQALGRVLRRPVGPDFGSARPITIELPQER